MTLTIQQPSPSRHPRWEAFKRSFRQSNYVTDFWNWLMTLMSKAAELVLFGSVLYSGYQLLPNITHAPAQVDALVFVIQQAALDIGGMGLLKLARRAGLPKDAFPVRVGITLVLLMILNVVLASLKQALPVIPAAVFVWVETVLLIARAVMAVLFGHAIHALREEYSESTITVKEASELREEIEQVTSQLAGVQLHVQQQRTKHVILLHHLHTELHRVQQEVYLNVQSEVQQRREQVNVQFQEVQSQVHLHVQSEVHRFVEQLPNLLHAQLQQVREQQWLNPSAPMQEKVQPRPGKGAVGQGPTVNPATAPQAGAGLHPGSEPLEGKVNPVSRVNPPSEQSKGALVRQFIREHYTQGHLPTLDEIMRVCQCSKNTAIAHRRAVLAEHQQAAPQPKLTIIRAASNE